MTEEAYVRECIADMRRGEMSEHLFHTVLSGDPAVAWRLLRRIIEAAPEDLLGDLGAGDLETFFRNHGDAYRDQIEQAARRDRNIAAALRSVWAYEAPRREALDRLVEDLGHPG